MPIDARNHKRTYRAIFIALGVFCIGFSCGVYGAHAALRSAPTQPVKLAIRKATILKVRPATTETLGLLQKTQTPAQVTAAATLSAAKVSKKNTIVIPRMNVNSAILEGPNAKTLNKGIWHLPGSSDPIKGGNMVISAHRYMWRPPSTKTFWDIDKMQVGDEITITWEGKTYVYKVATTYIVGPERVDVIADTSEPRLTLFSCTPKFTSKYRLIVEAYPVDA